MFHVERGTIPWPEAQMDFLTAAPVGLAILLYVVNALLVQIIDNRSSNAEATDRMRFNGLLKIIVALICLLLLLFSIFWH